MGEAKQRLYTLAEMTEYLQLSREKVLELVQKEGLPARKIGKQWRFYIEEVDAWIKESCSRGGN
ncbi:MAG: helix-turn-helix domain-containing protein [Firmicutes bacterium]|nr:helix-turn-helix domain-containing protein [Bacillota bacterium]